VAIKMKQQLQRLSAELAALSGQATGRPIMVHETGPDESVLIGTEQQILRLAQALIDSVVEAKPARSGLPGGVMLLESNAVSGKLDPCGTVALDWVLITSSQEDTAMVVQTAYS
jgi:hypothetical protein